MVPRAGISFDMKRSKVERLVRRSLAIGAVLLAGVFVSQPSKGAIVERIVAVVGERPILLSELRQRGRPHLFRIAASTQNASQQAAAESEMFRELLTRLIDERLEEQAADKAHLTVTPEEVDNGIRQVAGQARLDPKVLVAEAKRQGLTEQDYRDEIRRQVLEGKLIQLRVRGRVRITEQDARSAYATYLKEVGQQSPVELRILVLSVPPGASQQTANARTVLGEELSRRAKGGEDFCQLVLAYSDDTSTKSTCGSRGPVPLNALFPELQEIARTQKIGDTSAPIVFKDPNGQQAVLVVQTVATQGKVPPYDQVKDQMMERAFVEATERQRKMWLQELRRGVYIDVRL
jgi:peptidyl-prolyl cis-trans isomerase SurA